MFRTVIKEILGKDVDAFIDFPIKIEELKEMWGKSKEQGVSKFLFLEKVSESKIKDYKELLERMCTNKSKIKNKIYLDTYDYRRRYYNSICMMMEIVKKVVYTSVIKDDIKENIINEIDSILQKRNMIILNYIRTIMNEKSITEKMNRELNDNDNSIIEVIEKVHEIVVFQECGEVNLALNAKVFCDSEKSNALASYAVNGILDDDFNCWMSSYEYPEHWLMIDLGNVLKVSKVVVRHHQHKRILITSDFTIEGSADKTKWIELAKIMDNEKRFNIIDFKPIDIRYLKINITKANRRNSNEARIFSFEVY